jgi:hypothetical protein
MRKTVIALFVGVLTYLAVNQTQLVANYFATPPKSAAWLSNGDVYGICSPIQDL